ncbi:uncharacterized protein TRUGW13939_10091 [Talaromyces rugulosus]|uniref:MARVEL domain-containing protein n=1 Tax=Talaromyces rugulosus TaxID=121627 RepID=A0A7H8REG5_TALRU|nr:uncharacterized protein TRUGW13939_10091 [Talaromyces rugulosus]QKX62923.1 hypothetical protein TRUGW13939_10091 [Talaromyces rugulosus]
MPKIVGLALRGLEFVFTVILLGLVGALENNSSDNPESVHFSMFTAAFSIVFLFYLIPATWSEGLSGHPIILIVIDALNAVFFFCAAITLSARTRGHSCGDHSFLNSNSIAKGSSSRCHEAQAAAAFFWFGWASYMASLALSAVGAKSGANLRPRPAVQRPGMSQV